MTLLRNMCLIWHIFNWLHMCQQGAVLKIIEEYEGYIYIYILFLCQYHIDGKLS